MIGFSSIEIYFDFGCPNLNGAKEKKNWKKEGENKEVEITTGIFYDSMY